MPKLRLIERIAALGDVSGAQEQVARYLEMAYHDLPFATLETIADASGVSKATALRFVQRLGYGNLQELKEELRKALYSQSESPAQRATELKRPRDIATLLARHHEQEIANVDATLAALDPAAVAAFCESLVAARRVWVYGQRFSYGLAFNLGLLLSQVLPAVTTISGAAGTLPDVIAGAERGDHAVIFAHRRVGSEKVALGAYLADRRVPYSLITDLPAAGDDPLQRDAAHILRSVTASVGAFNSYVASHALLQAIAVVLETQAPTAIDRLSSTEIALQRFRAFREGR